MKITYSAEAYAAIWKAGVSNACREHVGAILGEDPSLDALKDAHERGLLRLTVDGEPWDGTR